MKTYLTINFNSEGAKPSDVISALESMGFAQATGFYDFQYDWGDDATLDDVIMLADKVSTTLKGMAVLFKVETIIPTD